MFWEQPYLTNVARPAKGCLKSGDEFGLPASDRGAAVTQAQRLFDESQADRLQLLVVLDRPVMAPRDGYQPAAARPYDRGELPRMRHRHLLIALGVKQQQRGGQSTGFGLEPVRFQKDRHRGEVGVEPQRALLQPAPESIPRCGADRHHRGGLRPSGREDGQVAAHAGAAQGDRSGPISDRVAQQRCHCRCVIQGTAVHGALALPVPPLIERHRRQAKRDCRPGEVVVALLAGIGAVQDHYARALTVGRLGREPEAVGQAVGGAGVRREQRSDGARATTISFGLVTTTAAELSHVYPLGTRVNARGRLELGGCDAVELAREFGTPAYIVVEDDLRARARAFVDAVAARHRDFDVLFASKAFPCTAVYRVLAQEGLACDVASGGELALALGAGFDPRRTYMHGNAKSAAELREALQAEVGHIVVDSLDELERLERIATEMLPPGQRQEVLIRVTPDVAGDTHHKISTGQADSKFGFSMQSAPQAIERLGRSASLELVGLHAHIGSQLFDLEPFRAAVAALASLGDFPVYNLGGGLGAAYTADQHPPSPERWVDAVVDTCHARLGPDKRLLLEPGRALVANSTVTLYTVQTVKQNVSTWVAVDGGMSDNLRPMLYDARYEALIADRPLAADGERCRLAGKHCESGDVLARDVTLPTPAPGDVVVTPVTGAYGYSLANNYNGVPRPPVVFCRDGEARVVVRRETYADLVSRDVEFVAPR